MGTGIVDSHIWNFSFLFSRGKTKPLDLLKKDKAGSYIDLFLSMGEVNGNMMWISHQNLPAHVFSKQDSQM